MSVGRPSSLTPEIQETILQYVREGALLKHAAAKAGVSRKTVYAWLKRARRTAEADKPFREFRSAYLEASAIACFWLERLAHGVPDPENPFKDITPREALELLGRRCREDWGRDPEWLKEMAEWHKEEKEKRKAAGNG